MFVIVIGFHCYIYTCFREATRKRDVVFRMVRGDTFSTRMAIVKAESIRLEPIEKNTVRT